MIVNNFTRVDGPTIVRDLQKKYVRSEISSFVLAAIISICGFALLVTGIILKSTINIVFGAIFGAFGLIYSVISIRRTLIQRTAIVAENKIVYDLGCEYNYRFKQESVFVELNAGEKHVKYEFKYSEVKKIIEHPTRYEMRLDDNTILYIDKSGFENERMIGFFIKNIQFNKKKIKVSSK